MNTTFLGPLFGAIKEIASLIPDFSERKKAEIEKETNEYYSLMNKFNKAALEFGVGSHSDELLGLADAVNLQAKKLADLYMIYAKEIKEGKNE